MFAVITNLEISDYEYKKINKRKASTYELN